MYYNKASLNTNNWPKTEFIYLRQSSRNCFEFSEKRILLRIFYLQLHSYSLLIVKTYHGLIYFSMKEDFSAPLVFHSPGTLLLTGECSRGYSISFSLWSVILGSVGCDLDSRATFNYQAGKVIIYKHIYIRKSQIRLTSGTGNPGWSLM